MYQNDQGGYEIMSNDIGWNSSQFPEKHLAFLTLEIPAESPLERSRWEIGWSHHYPTQVQTPMSQNPGQQLSFLSNTVHVFI